MSKLSQLAAKVLPQTGLEEFASNEQVGGVDLNAQALATEQALAELVQTATLENEVTQDLETFVNARAALEGWHDMAQRSLSKGGLRPETAEAIAFGVKAIEDAMGIEKRIMPGLEAFGGSSSMHQATTLGLEGFKDSFKKIMDGYRRAFSALVSSAQDAYASATKVGEKLVTRAEGLRKRVSALASASSEADISVRDGKLFADGVFVGANALPMLPLLTFVTDTWPKVQEQYAEELFAACTTRDVSPDIQAVLSKLLNTGKLFTAFPGTEQAAGQAGQDLKRSVIVGGNKALFGGFVEASPPKGVDLKAVSAHLRSIVLEVRDVQGAKVAPNDFSVAVPAAKTLITTLDSVIKVAGVLASAKKPSVKAKVNDLADEWFTANEDDERADWHEFMRVYESVPMVISAVARLNVTGVTYHLGTVLNAMLSLAQQQVEALEKAK